MSDRAARATGRPVVRLFAALVLAVGVAVVAIPGLVLADQGEAPPPVGAVQQGKLSVGGLHTCAVLTSGGVQCWGSNDQGQLGNGSITTSTSPSTVSGISTATAIAAGNTHTCALQSGGSVKCWGQGGNGQLGDGFPGDPGNQLRTTPVTVSGINDATAIATGGFHSCAIVTDGEVRCWGDDGLGQLGDGTLGDYSLVPVEVSGLTGATALAAGEFFTCALRDDSTVWCWGANGFGQLGDGTTTDSPGPVEVAGLPDPDEHPALALTAGNGHACVLVDDIGEPALCWGANTFGQLGHKTVDANPDPEITEMVPSPTPLVVQIDADPTPNGELLEPLINVRSMSAGQFHTCSLIGGGAARCWGQNGRGALGTDPNASDDELTDSSSAVVVGGLSGASAVTAGGFHSCAIVGTGMACWGYNFYGQLGGYEPESTVPVQVTAATGMGSVTTGFGFACAVRIPELPGPPACWGRNNHGQLGAGLNMSSTTIRVNVAGLSGVDAIDAGSEHACALPAGTQSPVCWGRGADGRLGNGSSTSSNVPVPVSGLTNAASVAAGLAHTCARRSDEKVSCWGFNASGQLGNNTTTSSSTPVTVLRDPDPDDPDNPLEDLAGIEAVIVGVQHSCALASDTTVWCWGLNSAGQLGDGTNVNRRTAVQVQTDDDPDVNVPLTGVNVVVAGFLHTCAILSTGSMRCWGNNSSGQLGDDTTEHRSLPVAVAGIDAELRAEVAAAGDGHTCARLSDGSVACWGLNSSGQLGVGDHDDRHVPTTVVGLGPTDDDVPEFLLPLVKSISAGATNTCAVQIDTTVYCWGSNPVGILGDGVGAERVSPIAVEGLAGPV